MTRPGPKHFDDSDDWNDDDPNDFDPEDGDLEGDDPEDDDSTDDCPHCHRPIYDDAEKCPYCDQYISQLDAPREKRPLWLIIGVILCLYAVYRWTFC